MCGLEVRRFDSVKRALVNLFKLNKELAVPIFRAMALWNLVEGDVHGAMGWIIVSMVFVVIGGIVRVLNRNNK